MKIEVKKCDIEKADRLRLLFVYAGINLEKCCPIAQAIRRKTKKKVRVGGSSKNYRVLVGNRKGKLPLKAQDLVNAWDNRITIRPISFELELN